MGAWRRDAYDDGASQALIAAARERLPIQPINAAAASFFFE
jgi:hypothetical protein